jgi:uncharacterized membrane protein YidH (DUF202 family)
MTLAAILLQQVVSEANENRVLLRVITIGLTIFFLSAGALYALFRSFEQGEKRTDRRSVILLVALIVVVALACLVLFRMALTSELY